MSKSHTPKLDQDLTNLFDGSMPEDWRWCQVETNKRRAHKIAYMHERLGMKYAEIGRVIDRSRSRVEQIYGKLRYRSDYPPSYVQRYIDPDVAARNSALEIREALRKRTGFSHGDQPGEQIEAARDFVVKLRMKSLIKALGELKVRQLPTEDRDWLTGDR